MNPNQMNVAKAMVAQHELLEEARRSRSQAKAERTAAPLTATQMSPWTGRFLGFLGLGLQGRR
ncbi:MAG: hypothetical protein QM729_02335 [Solirubrobacterales bacterium]